MSKHRHLAASGVCAQYPSNGAWVHTSDIRNIYSLDNAVHLCRHHRLKAAAGHVYADKTATVIHVGVKDCSQQSQPHPAGQQRHMAVAKLIVAEPCVVLLPSLQPNSEHALQCQACWSVR